MIYFGVQEPGFTWLHCGCVTSQVASEDLPSGQLRRGSLPTLPRGNRRFSWLSRDLIAAFGNLAVNGFGNARMTLELCSRLGPPRAS